VNINFAANKIMRFHSFYKDKYQEVTNEVENIFLLVDICDKSRRLRWDGHVARMGRGEVHTGFWWET
jgi:hypothetical protein